MERRGNSEGPWGHEPGKVGQLYEADERERPWGLPSESLPSSQGPPKLRVGT